MAEIHQPLATTPRAVTTWRESKRTRARIGRWIGMIALLIGSIPMLTPFLWMISTALKQSGKEFVYPPEWLPNPVVWGNYIQALTMMPFHIFLANTLIITILSMAGVLITGSMTAFGFSRLRFPLKNFWFAILLSTVMLPSIITLIPTFVLFRTIGWYDTFLPLIVPNWFGGGAFNVFLMRQFFMTIPIELDEAARIDGASNWTIYWRMILPLSKPVLATVGILGFLFFWNDFLNPLIYISSMDKRTLAIGLRAFQGLYGTQWNLMMAAATVMVIPVIMLFFAAQRYFVRGIQLSGLSGR